MADAEFRGSIHVAPAFRTPRLLAKFVRRPETLIPPERIAQATLVLVHAPAGYGKTTWMSYQAAALQDAGYRIVWYCLDEHEGGESFVTRLRRGLELALGEAGHSLLGEHWSGAAQLLEVLGALDETVAIFFDDVDASDDASLAAARLSVSAKTSAAIAGFHLGVHTLAKAELHGIFHR